MSDTAIKLIQKLFKLPTDLIERLDKYVEKHDTNASQVVRIALDKFLKSAGY